jgi:hypothetical protein
MNALKNVGNKTLETKVLSGKGWRLLFALVLVVASLFVVVPPQLARADAGGVKGHTFDFTFTKWVTSQPNPSSMVGALMAGIVGGDVGNGSYAGEVITYDDTSEPGFTLINARYEFHGEKHSFIADVDVVDNNSTAEITGVITQGWLKGAQITGEYTVLPVCSNPTDTPDNVFGTLCFQGTLHVHRPR